MKKVNLTPKDVLDIMQQIADEINEQNNQYEACNVEMSIQSSALKNESLDTDILNGHKYKLLMRNPYVQQNKIIERTFQCKKVYNIESIILRLTIIDSLYSTNARYSQFSIEELAFRIYSIGSEQNAISYFESVVSSSNDLYNVFGDKFGIHKNGSVGSKLTSLASKYAYYALKCDKKSPLGFPIYDSLVKEVYPTIAQLLQINNNVAHHQLGNSPFIQYVQNLNRLRVQIFGNNISRFCSMQQFDLLDAYLWRLGKLKNGSLTLLFNKQDYVQIIENLFGSNVLNSSLSQLKSSLNISNPKLSFDDLVVLQCKKMTTSAILNGINRPVMNVLIDHCKHLGFL